MPPTDPALSAPNPVEAEVRANILDQHLVEGRAEAGTVAALNLPEAFVVRIADRIIRSTFEERHRNVYDDRVGGVPPPPPSLFLLDREARPPLRNYRASIAPTDDRWPSEFPDDADPPELRRAAVHIAARLADDGVPCTLLDACRILSPLFRDAPGRVTGLLQRAGFPVDLLDFFSLDSRPLPERVLSILSRGENRDLSLAELARARFDFRQTRPGFHAVDEAGSQPVSLVRMQATRPSHWEGDGGGPNSGDNLDLLLHLLRALPRTRFLLSVASEYADALSAFLAAAGADASRITVLPAELPVSQWAQDNMKPGLIDAGSGLAALLPRYASRAEDGAKLDAGDSAALSNLPAARITPIHSPLHFQGGNVLLIRRPGGERLLLIGEAEIARNVSLGLTPAQAEAALRIEMGADASLVLPAVDFHLDSELSVRTVGNETIAFVPDQESAARIILRCAIRAMESARFFQPGDSRALLAFLDHRNDEKLVAALGGLLSRISDPAGNVPGAYAALLRSGPHDSGVANAMRVLLSLDILTSLQPRPWEPSLHPHAQAYFRALRRTTRDRLLLVDMLTRAGMRVVRVPSISAGNRSASVINSVHLPDLTLVPARGGFLKALDDAAIKVLRTHLPPTIRIIPIPAAESERRGGALHCSVAAFPDAP